MNSSRGEALKKHEEGGVKGAWLGETVEHNGVHVGWTCTENCTGLGGAIDFDAVWRTVWWRCGVRWRFLMMEGDCVGCTVWWRWGVVRQRCSSEIDYSLAEVQDSDGTLCWRDSIL